PRPEAPSPRPPLMHYNAANRRAQEEHALYCLHRGARCATLSRVDTSAAAPQVSFETHPSRYRHWTLTVEGEIARLTMKVQPFGGQDAEVELGAGSAGDGPEPQAKAYQLKSNSYDLSVDIELADAVQRLRFTHPSVKAVLVDDGSSTVSLPEVPLLGVLPGTGGLTRVVDKRKVRRDLADAFSTLAEGVKGKRAVEWGLVDAVVPRSKFAETILQRAKALA